MGRSLLIMVSGFFIVFGIVQMSLNERQKIIPVRPATYHQEQQTLNLSASLAQYAIAEIKKDQNWVPPDSIPNFMGGFGYISVYDDQDYLNDPASLPPDNSVPSWDEYTLLVFVEAFYNGIESKTEVLLQKDSFSKYSYFTDYEPNIYFFDKDTLTGPVHTNGVFHIAGSPVFNGMVTSPNMWEGHPNYEPDGNTPQFLGGSDFEAEPSLPPTSYDLEYIRNAATGGGLKFDDPIRVQFNNDGTVDIEVESGGSWSSPNNYNLSMYNGIISSTQKVYTKGTVKGQVTLHSEVEIEILGDLKYETDPLENPNSTDILGLVSEGDVIIDEQAHTDSGTEDITIQASIMALNESFSVENYNSGSSRGIINLLGGIIQKERGPVGTFSGGSVASGFSKSYVYDERLLEQVPPSFPRESIFSITYWKDYQLTMTN